MTTAPVQCDDCNRPIVVGPILWDGKTPYGPRCGRARGLTPGRRARARKPAPVRAVQPALAGWDELTEEEINEEEL